MNSTMIAFALYRLRCVFLTNSTERASDWLALVLISRFPVAYIKVAVQLAFVMLLCDSGR